MSEVSPLGDVERAAGERNADRCAQDGLTRGAIVAELAVIALLANSGERRDRSIRAADFSDAAVDRIGDVDVAVVAIENDAVRLIECAVLRRTAVAAETRATVAGERGNAAVGADAANEIRALLGDVDVSCSIERHAANVEQRDFRGELAVVRAAAGEGDDRLRVRRRRQKRDEEKERCRFPLEDRRLARPVFSTAYDGRGRPSY